MVDFNELEYNALRSEILGIKERIVRLQIVGLTGIPLVVGAGHKYDLTAVLLVAPLVVGIFATILVSEQNSLMRAGHYIRNQFEHNESSVPPGWESWLHCEPKRTRKSESFFALSALLAFAVYYLLSIVSAFSALKCYEWRYEWMNRDFSILITVVYAALFVVGLFAIWTNLETNN